MTNDLIFTIIGNSFDNNDDGDSYTFDNEDEYTIDWGDGTVETYEPKHISNNTVSGGYISHNYSTSGEHTVTVSGGVKGIGAYAFYNTSLSSITLPDTLTYISGWCFAMCTNLTSITIPSSVTKIENYWIDSCSNLESITFESDTPMESASIISYGIPTSCIIRVPSGSLSAYQNAEGFPDPNTYTYVEYTPESSSSSGSLDPTATLYNHIKQLNKQWFYEKSEIDQSLLTKSIAIVEKSSANSGAFKTYQITQGGVAVSGEIDIPKDFLVKSGSIKTAGSTPTTAESNAGVLANEKYISLIINTKDNETSSGNTELIIPAKGLVEDTLYYADESTITLYVDSNDGNKNKFKIKDGGVDTTQLKNGAVTSDKIASAVKNSWVLSSDVENAINGALNDLAELIYPTSNQNP